MIVGLKPAEQSATQGPFVNARAEPLLREVMIRRIDQWIGTRLFHPPIVWLCQRTGMTQYAVARYGWMLAAWTLVMRISFEGVGDWIFSALILVVTLLETWRAAVMPNAPTRRSDGLRILILLFATFDVGLLVVVSARHGFPGFRWGHAWDLFALTAEYAKTIRTIPPRRRKALGQASGVGLPVRSRAGTGGISRRAPG